MAKSNGFVLGLLAGAAAVVGAVAVMKILDEKKKKETEEELFEIKQLIEDEQ